MPTSGSRQGCPQWEVNEHHLGYHNMFCFTACSDSLAPLGAKWGREGWEQLCQMAGPEELEWGTYSPEAPPEAGSMGTWQAAALMSQSLFGLPRPSPSPRLTPRVKFIGLEARLGERGYVTT